jgi:pilus assembly protein CpaF
MAEGTPHPNAADACSGEKAEEAAMELHERLASSPANEVVQHLHDPFAAIKNRIHLSVIEDLGRQLFTAEADPAKLRPNVIEEIRGRLEHESGISRDDRKRLVEELTDDIMGHGPLERLLADDTVSEIMVNAPDDVWIEREGILHRTTVRFTDESQLRRIINKMVAEVGRRIDEGQPMVDARMPDGSRINAIIPPLSLAGALLTIRKFGAERLNIDSLVRLGTLTPETADLLRRCVEARLNILISGGTGAGKTTLLNAMSAAIPDSERIVTIEDAAELRLAQRHVLRLECRPKNIEGEGEVTIRDLVRNTLRMRPDRIVVGEVRGAETLDMLQAMNTGHDGSLSTVHANSPRDALARIETMVLMAGYDLPLRAIRQQAAAALDLVIQLERVHDGSRKVMAITEVQRMESDVITLQELYRFHVDAVASDRAVVGQLVGTGLRPGFLDKFEKRGVKLPSWLTSSTASAHAGRPSTREAAA